jgi:hypothetical protein
MEADRKKTFLRYKTRSKARFFQSLSILEHRLRCARLTAKHTAETKAELLEKRWGCPTPLGEERPQPLKTIATRF